MELEKLAPFLPGILSALGGLRLIGARRRRLITRSKDYAELASLPGLDGVTVHELQELRRETIESVVQRDRTQLHRKVDGGTVAALVLLLAPAVSIFILALDWDGGLQVVAMAGSVIWAMVWSGTALASINEKARDKAK